MGEFDEKKLLPVIIGNGSPDDIAAFRTKTGYPGKIYTDPTRETYRIAGFLKGIQSTMNFSSLKAGARAFLSGYRQEKIQGDPLQQGGIVGVLPEGTLCYLYRSRFAGDQPDPSNVFSACGT